jgi:hypothetical protein
VSGKKTRPTQIQLGNAMVKNRPDQSYDRLLTRCVPERSARGGAGSLSGVTPPQLCSEKDLIVDFALDGRTSVSCRCHSKEGPQRAL